MRALRLIAVLLFAPMVPADHVESVDGQDVYRCDGGWCRDGQTYVLDCGGIAAGDCRGDVGGFTTIIRPTFSPVSAPRDALEDTDIVVGVSIGDDHRAYPLRIISGENGWEVIEDHVGGLPILVTYCPLCKSAVVWSRVVDGDILTFYNSGAIWKYDLVMYDVQTGSMWSQVSGESIGRPTPDAFGAVFAEPGAFEDGPFHGHFLDLVPASTVQWGAWRESRPDGIVMDVPADDGRWLCGCHVFRARLDIAAGVLIDEQAVAFPHDAFGPRTQANATIAGRELTAVFAGHSVHVFDITGLQVAWDGTWLVDAAGTRYHPITGVAAGRSASGSASGSAGLEVAPAITLSLAEWINFHPETLVWEREVGAVPAPVHDTPGIGLVPVLAVVVAALLLGKRR